MYILHRNINSLSTCFSNCPSEKWFQKQTDKLFIWTTKLIYDFIGIKKHMAGYVSYKTQRPGNMQHSFSSKHWTLNID